MPDQPAYESLAGLFQKSAFVTYTEAIRPRPPPTGRIATDRSEEQSNWEARSQRRFRRRPFRHARVRRDRRSRSAFANANPAQDKRSLRNCRSFIEKLSLIESTRISSRIGLTNVETFSRRMAWGEIDVRFQISLIASWCRDGPVRCS